MKSALRLFLISLVVTSASLWAAESSKEKQTEGKKTEAVQPAQETDSTQYSDMTPTVPDLDEMAAEERPEPPTYEGAFLKMILVLILLLFIIFFGIWVVRRLSRSRLRMFKEPKHIRIIDRRPLSAKTALYLVEVGEKRVLVAESQLEIKGLATTELEPEE